MSILVGAMKIIVFFDFDRIAGEKVIGTNLEEEGVVVLWRSMKDFLAFWIMIDSRL